MYQARLNAAGESCDGPLDHGFVQSIYFFDPNGIQVEITARTANYVDIMADEKSKAVDELTRWTADTRAFKSGRGLKMKMAETA